MTAPRLLVLLVVLGGIGIAATPAVAGQSGVTPVYENVTSDATWTAEEGPYRVVEDVTVGSEATLTVTAGTTVEVAEGVSLAVAGTLRANGTAGAPVRFVASGTEPAPGDWGAIRTAGQGKARIDLTHVAVAGATNAVVLQNPSATVTLTDARINDTGGAAIRGQHAAGDTTVTVRDSTFEDVGGDAIAVTRTELLPVAAVSGWTIRGSEFRNLEGAGLDLHAERIAGLTVADTYFAELDGPAVALETERLRAGTLRGNTIDAAPAGLRIDVGDVDTVTIRDNRIRPAGTAIDIHLERNVHDLAVLDNDAVGGDEALAIGHDPRDDGYYSFDLRVAHNDVSGQEGDALALRSSLFSDMHVAVEHNTVTGADGNGLLVTVGALEDATVRNNTVRGTGGTGVLVAARHVRRSTLANNTVRDAGRSGIDVTARRSIEQVRIHDNDLLNNARDGLAVRSGRATAGNYTIRQNIVAANAYGVVLEGPQTANLTRNAVVHNTVAFGQLVERSAMAPGVGILVQDGAENVTLSHNDVYGNRAGLATRMDGTVHARENFWGAASGPYHPSINPGGNGDAIVTTEGWVAVVRHRDERVHRAYERPEAAIAASPEPHRVNQTIVLSGANATDPDGTVARYQFTVAGQTRVSGAPVRHVSFGSPGTYAASLWVEDQMGIESANPARLRLQVDPRVTTSTSPPTSTTATGPTAESPTTSAPQRDGVGALGWFGGLLGGALYGIAVVFGLRGMYQTLAERPLTVRGRRIHLSAVLGVAIWGLTSILGPSSLRILAGAGLLAWVLGTGVAYVVVRMR